LGPFYEENWQKSSEKEAKDNIYLNVDSNQKGSPYSRKVTENTDFTKADSAHKSNENSKQSNSKIGIQKYDIESFPNANIFATKYEDQELFSPDIDEVKVALPNHTVSLNAKIVSVDSSLQCSDMENSELKQTADFFRPGSEIMSKPTSQKFPFKRKKDIQVTNTNLKSHRKNFDWGAKIKFKADKICHKKKFSEQESKTSFEVSILRWISQLPNKQTDKETMTKLAEIRANKSSRNVRLKKHFSDSSSFLLRIKQNFSRERDHRVEKEWMKQCDDKPTQE